MHDITRSCGRDKTVLTRARLETRIHDRLVRFSFGKVRQIFRRKFHRPRFLLVLYILRTLHQRRRNAILLRRDLLFGFCFRRLQLNLLESSRHVFHGGNNSWTIRYVATSLIIILSKTVHHQIARSSSDRRSLYARSGRSALRCILFEWTLFLHPPLRLFSLQLAQPGHTGRFFLFLLILEPLLLPGRVAGHNLIPLQLQLRQQTDNMLIVQFLLTLLLR